VVGFAFLGKASGVQRTLAARNIDISNFFSSLDLIPHVEKTAFPAKTAAFRDLERPFSESNNYFRAFPKLASDCGIQDGLFKGLAGLNFA
jgi:hypothetical protein